MQCTAAVFNTLTVIAPALTGAYFRGGSFRLQYSIDSQQQKEHGPGVKSSTQNKKGK